VGHLWRLPQRELVLVVGQQELHDWTNGDLQDGPSNHINAALHEAETEVEHGVEDVLPHTIGIARQEETLQRVSFLGFLEEDFFVFVLEVDIVDHWSNGTRSLVEVDRRIYAEVLYFEF